MGISCQKMCFVVLVLSSMAWGDEGKPDPSVVPSDRKPISEKVENGVVYDQASIPINGFDKIVVPETARVIEEESKEIQVFMAKTLSFGGHPPEPITLRHARQYMGCATKTEQKVLQLATFGEWDTRKEGNASVRLVIVVPKGFTVEKQAKLAGPESVANQSSAQGAPPKGLKDGYWYGPTSPAEGWTQLAQKPDAERRAQPKK